MKVKKCDYKFAVEVSGVLLTELLVEHLYSLGYEWFSGKKMNINALCERTESNKIGIDYNGKISYNVHEEICDEWYDIDEYIECHPELMEDYVSIKMGLL